MDEESLFAAALERATPGGRRAFLDAACAGDLALRRSVEILLEAHERSTGILDQAGGPPGLATVTAPAGPPRPPGIERHGDLLAGRYRLLEPVGEGGMGTVWAATQEHPVRRTVAIKLIKPGMDSRTVLARFDAERQALALMDHPHIAKVLDAGTTDAGRPFFVMEFVPGVPVTHYADGARLGIRGRVELLVSVCRAVQHAHAKGVIHRDLKPSNILVGLADGHPLPRVIDFGLAKATRTPLTDWTLETAHGVMMGTPLYISPEQADSFNLDVDTRTDIYALGAILYELLTGSTPLEARRFHEGSWAEVLRLIKEEEPPRPSVRLGASPTLAELAACRGLEPSQLIRGVRGELDWIVMKCLEKDRSRRYDSAGELGRDLERYLGDEAVEACPPSARYRLGKLARRHRGPASAAVAIVLVLVAGVAGTSWGLVRAERAKAQAQKRLQQIERGSELLASVFNDLDPRAEEKEGRPLRAILGDRLDRAASDLEGDAVGEPLVVAGLQDRLGRTYRALGHAAKAKAMFTKALEIRRSLLGVDDASTLAVMSQLASALHDIGEVNEALALFEQVRDAQVRTLGADHPDTLATGQSLGLAYWKAGRAGEACAVLEPVRDALSGRFGPDDSRTIDALEGLSGVYMTLGKGTEAIALARQVRDARVKRYGPDHTLAIASLNNLALRYRAAGQMRQALALFEEARDELAPRLAADHPSTLMILDSLAGMYRAFGRTAEAIALAERVRDARVMTLGAYNPYTIHTFWNLGLAYQAADEPEKALAQFQQAAAGLEKLDFTHAEAGSIVQSLCGCLERRGQLDRADQWRRKWLAAAKESRGPDSAGYAGELANQGEDLLRSRRFTAAEPILSECVAILRRKQPGTPADFHAQSLLGGVLLGLNRYAEAEPLLVRGYEGLEALRGQLPPLYARQRVTEACRRVVRLYEAQGRADKAAEWETKLHGLGEPHPRP
jgi:serine/threonine protein kinase/tetratricopeptide (TPR) repeat protein